MSRCGATDTGRISCEEEDAVVAAQRRRGWQAHRKEAATAKPPPPTAAEKEATIKAYAATLDPDTLHFLRLCKHCRECKPHMYE